MAARRAPHGARSAAGPVTSIASAIDGNGHATCPIETDGTKRCTRLPCSMDVQTGGQCIRCVTPPPIVTPPPMRLSSAVRFALLIATQWLMTGATGGAATAPADTEPAQRLMGHWARSLPACRRPELILKPGSALVQTDIEGQALAFSYDAARYSTDGRDRIKVELGKLHPYDDTSSRTALTFRVVSPDEIDLLKARTVLTFKRCTDDPPR